MAFGDQIYAMREVVGVPGVYEHHGIDCGMDGVIHYYKGGEIATITATPRELFARGSRIFIKHQSVSFLPDSVVQRARSRLGEQRYDLLTNNCEHFATWCKTGRHESEQLAGFGLQLDHWKLPEVQHLIEGTAHDRPPDEAIAVFQQALTDISSAHSSLKRQYDEAKHERDSWARVAVEALQRDREDLARAALFRKRTAQQKIDDFTRQLAELGDVQLTLEKNCPRA